MPAFLLSTRRASLAAAAFALLGCAGERRPEADRDRDDFGAPLPAPVAAPRIVSLNPTTTEILFALGAGARIVGRSRWDQWPVEARRVPEVGDALRPSLERVIAAAPDLVLLYASAENRAAAAALADAGIPVAAFRVDRIDDFTRTVERLGTLTAREAEARLLVDSVSASLASVRDMYPPRTPRPTVFLHAWDNPLMTIGAGSFLSELVEIAGGRNVYADLAPPSVQVSFEDLMRRDPDVVLTGPRAAERLRADARWQALRAVRTGRVIAYDTMLVGRPSVRIGEGARSLAALLHAAPR